MAEKSKKETNGTQPEETSEAATKTENKEETAKPTCGIMMPISEIDGCSAQHWSEVLTILQEAIESAGFIGSLVSESDEMGVIHKTIVQNTYHSDIVVCDVSGKNPNVMFELGLRLAFDKPTVLIKDESTDFSFDTSTIRHLPYPRDLNYHKMVELKKLLKAKLEATHLASKADTEYSPFLKNFGEFTVAKLENKEVSPDVYIVNALNDLRTEIRQIKQSIPNKYNQKLPSTYIPVGKTKAVQVGDIPETITLLSLRFDGTEVEKYVYRALGYLSVVFPSLETNIKDYKSYKILEVSFPEPIGSNTLLKVLRDLERAEIEANSFAAA